MRLLLRPTLLVPTVFSHGFLSFFRFIDPHRLTVAPRVLSSFPLRTSRTHQFKCAFCLAIFTLKHITRTPPRFMSHVFLCKHSVKGNKEYFGKYSYKFCIETKKRERRNPRNEEQIWDVYTARKLSEALIKRTRTWSACPTLSRKTLQRLVEQSFVHLQSVFTCHAAMLTSCQLKLSSVSLDHKSERNNPAKPSILHKECLVVSPEKNF